MKKLYSICLCLLLGISLIGVQKAPAKAWVMGLKRSPNNWIYFQLHPQTLTGGAAMRNGMSAWVSTPTPVGASESSSGESYIIETFIADNWIAANDWDGVSKFWITLNRNITDGYTQNAKQSTVVHEIGHCWKLGDIKDYFEWTRNGSVPTIMYYGRDRNTMIVPQQDDINGVNYWY